jgi:uncharacterized protein YyaL (SSP411 family)
MDEIFEDKDGGGYWASEEDELVLVRMKDSQVGPLLLRAVSRDWADSFIR